MAEEILNEEESAVLILTDENGQDTGCNIPNRTGTVQQGQLFLCLIHWPYLISQFLILYHNMTDFATQRDFQEQKNRQEVTFLAVNIK